MDWQDELEKDLKSMVPFGYVTAVLMIILGIVMLFNPVGSLSGLLWVLIVGMALCGVGRLVMYGKAPAMLKQGFTLVMGIIDLVCAIMLGYCAAAAPQVTNEMFSFFIGIMLGFYAIIAGINSISATTFVRRLGGSSGFMTAAGVLDIIAGILLLAVPNVGAFFIMFALGFACIAAGINLFAATTDAKNRAKAFKEFQDNNGKPFDPDDDSFTTWWIG